MSLKDEIQHAQDLLSQAIAARDPGRAAALYTGEARLMPDGVPTCADAGAIRGFFEGAIGNGIVGTRFTTEEVDGDERQALEIGRYELFAAHPNGERIRVAEGRYLVAWRKEADGWRMHRDMFNRATLATEQ